MLATLHVLFQLHNHGLDILPSYHGFGVHVYECACGVCIYAKMFLDAKVGLKHTSDTPTLWHIYTHWNFYTQVKD